MSNPESRASARELLRSAAAKSKGKNVPFSREFVRAVPGMPDGPFDVPPLARLIQGGRGGSVRLRLYLLLAMTATQKPYDIRNPRTSYTLARTLDLPGDVGPRRITSNMNWLAANNFIELTKRPGQPSMIQLLDPLGTLKPMPDPRAIKPYVTIPIAFWSLGWLLELSPVAIAVLFSLEEALGGYKNSRYLVPGRRDSYGISQDSWTNGERELREFGLLTVTRTPRGEDYDYPRLRNSYWLKKSRLNAPPPEPAA